MVRKLGLCVVASLLLSVAMPAHADTVNVVGAGALPGAAADLTGTSVTEITGMIPDTPDPLLGVEMFKLNISDYLDFSAITNGLAFGIPDTELFLFDSSGLGVYGNDDIDAGNTLSCLPSADSGNPCSSARPSGVGPTSDGTYYLAITRSSNLPLSVSGDIFTILNFTDIVGPDLTMGGNDPITGWDGGAFTSPDTDLVNFDITLTGASAAVPEPGVLGLLALVLFCVALRKRQLTICGDSQSQMNS
jgi:PEP-CTERM motif